MSGDSPVSPDTSTKGPGGPGGAGGAGGGRWWVHYKIKEVSPS